jgi:hypothetical protein
VGVRSAKIAFWRASLEQARHPRPTRLEAGASFRRLVSGLADRCKEWQNKL